MLWAMLYYYLFSVAGSGLVYDIAEPVKQHVKVEATVKQIIAINKEMLKEDATFEKDTANAKQQLARIHVNRLASESDFAEAFAELDEKRALTRAKILDGRFKMRELMTAEEWRSVYAAVSQKE